MTRGYLLDLNVLIALVDESHGQHAAAEDWFVSAHRERWAICPLTEAGFLRVTTNPGYRPKPFSFEEALLALQMLKAHPRMDYWPIGASWVDLTAPFARRVRGHQQVTDAFLLGLAIRAGGVLVTFDRGAAYLAGEAFRQHVLLLS